MLKQSEMFAGVNQIPEKGLNSPEEQAIDLLEGLRRREPVKEEPQRRFELKEGVGEIVRCHEDVARIFRAILQAEHPMEREREHFWCLIQDVKNRIKSIELVSLGSLTAAVAHPREIFRRAVVEGANSIIIGHNHPSGDPTPSKEDIIGAVARGYTYKVNEDKVLDVDLCKAIVEEISKLLKEKG